MSALWTLLALFALFFVIGLNVGHWIANRMNRKLRNAQADLGKQFAEMLDDHRKTLIFANENVDIKTEYTFTSCGHRYTLVMSAHPLGEPA